MPYFVKLSTGEYSDYDPDYYMGEIKITREELDKKGIEVGDKLISDYMLLPERKYTGDFTWKLNDIERYNPENGKIFYPPGDSEWQPIMEKWLLEEKGYIKLDEAEIPEINVSYSDLPNSKNWKRW